MENKNSKTGAIIGTIVAVILCGCPGLCLLLMGILSAFGMGTWSSEFGHYVGYGDMPGWIGYVFICVSLFMIAVPIVVGLLTLRDKKPKDVIPPSNEPLPPVS